MNTTMKPATKTAAVVLALAAAAVAAGLSATAAENAPPLPSPVPCVSLVPRPDVAPASPPIQVTARIFTTFRKLDAEAAASGEPAMLDRLSRDELRQVALHVYLTCARLDGDTLEGMASEAYEALRRHDRRKRAT